MIETYGALTRFLIQLRLKDTDNQIWTITKAFKRMDAAKLPLDSILRVKSLGCCKFSSGMLVLLISYFVH